MGIKLFGFLVFILGASILYAQVEPTLPNTSSIVTCFPDTAGYTTITVGPINRDYSDLQEAIDAAEPGTIILLDAGEIFYGGFIIPDKGDSDLWIIIMSSRMDLLPPEGERVHPLGLTGDPEFPGQHLAMPKIITNNLSGIPCLKTEVKAHHYRFVGIQFTVDENVDESYGLIHLGSSGSEQHSMDLVPHHLIIDRCFIYGHKLGPVMKFGIRLDCANGAVVDSYISEFHSIGFDAQAISGVNGPGPFVILNNYLSASGENILFGGGVPAIDGLVPSDIEIRGNYFHKPWKWRVGHPAYDGKHWTVKNLFELKTGRRVLLEGNYLDNCWADLPIGQSGYAILLTVRTENGNALFADVSDITIRNNVIRHTGAGISLSGREGSLSNRSARIKISNNLFYDISGPEYGDGLIDGPNDGTFLKIGEPQDVWIDHNTVLQTGTVTWAYGITDGFVFTNNIIQSLMTEADYQGIYAPGNTQGNQTIANKFPDVTDANKNFHNNVLIGGDSMRYTNFTTLSRNYFPESIDDILFSNLNDTVGFSGYRLRSESPFKGLADDGSDPGVDIEQLQNAIAWFRDCDLLNTSVDEKGDDNIFQMYPNPAHSNVTITYPFVIDLPGILTLYNAEGIRLQEYHILSSKQKIELPVLAPGIYFAEMIFDDARSVEKLVIY